MIVRTKPDVELIFRRAVMKSLFVASVAFSSFLMVSPSNAAVTSASTWADGDGAIVCNYYGWDGLNNVLDMDGIQYGVPAHMIGSISTDTPLDPTITLQNTLDNDTLFAWTAYHVNVSMNNFFSIVVGSPTVYTPGGWTGVITQQPVLVGGSYVGQVDFTGGPQVNVGDTLDFSYKIQFSGSTSYSFTQELVAVPEPTSLGLLALGGALLGVRTVANRRRQ
jgi:hypothetical protein